MKAKKPVKKEATKKPVVYAKAPAVKKPSEKKPIKKTADKKTVAAAKAKAAPKKVLLRKKIAAPDKEAYNAPAPVQESTVKIMPQRVAPAAQIQTAATPTLPPKVKKPAPPEKPRVPVIERPHEKKAPPSTPQKVETIQERKVEKVAEEVKKPLTPLELELPITVKDLSVKLGEKPSALIKYLIEKQKSFVTINQSLHEDIIVRTLHDYGYEYTKKKSDEELLLKFHEADAKIPSRLRPPVVTFMGHVDHGKTSLLDAIRRSNVVDKEHGGITQHIGAYKVKTPRGAITFLDTPGHEAFTAMRARGANITDIVVLVVAADDGIMPQTVEAINHARAAGVPIVVAINKIDKTTTDIEKVKRQLSQHELTPEDWGGKTIAVGVSAKTGQGINDLLEMLALEAEILELKAPYETEASGVVIEAKLSKGQGSVVTVLVQRGTLHIGDDIICGLHYGKIRAMINDAGGRVESVTPGEPVEILGFSGLPEAGEKFYVLNDEKKLKELVDERQAKERQRRVSPEPKHISLEDLYAKIQKGEVKDLPLIIKADVQGSLEAIKGSLTKLETQEVKLNILHAGVGPINSSDVLLAEASNAIIIGFTIDADTQAKELAADKKVEIRTYRVIYELINEIKAAMSGLLAPKIKKSFMGKAEVKKVFTLSKSGVVAGCVVQKGKITRQATVQLMRGEEVMFEGGIAALKRFKDDVRDVQEGFECGISLAGFSDYKEGDAIIAYTIEKIAREL